MQRKNFIIDFKNSTGEPVTELDLLCLAFTASKAIAQHDELEKDHLEENAQNIFLQLLLAQQLQQILGKSEESKSESESEYKSDFAEFMPRSSAPKTPTPSTRSLSASSNSSMFFNHVKKPGIGESWTIPNSFFNDSSSEKDTASTLSLSRSSRSN